MRFQPGDRVLFWGELAVVERIVDSRVWIGFPDRSRHVFPCVGNAEDWDWPPAKWVNDSLQAHQRVWEFDRLMDGWVPA